MILAWLILTAAIAITAYILPGVAVKNFVSALIAALVLGIINAFIRPLLILISLPINILTLGLFTLVINALIIMLVSAIVPGFQVRNFWWALIFSIILAIINGVLMMIVF